MSSFKLLGVWISKDLSWNTYVHMVLNGPFEYACPVLWHSSLSILLSDQIEYIQKRALRIILPNMSYQESLSMLKLPTLTERRELLCTRFYKKNLCDTSSKLSE